MKTDNDLTKGKITKNLLAVSFPTMISFTSHTINDVADMIWIGKISADAVAAVTVFTTVFWVIVILNNIIGTSSISLISQNYGAKDYKKTAEVIEQTMTFKFIVAVIAMIITLLIMKPLFRLFTDDPIVFQHTLDYGYIRVFFLPIMFSTFSVTTSLICLGDAKRQMILGLLASALNIILDPIFIFDKVPFLNIPGLGLGVFGAALATVISFTFAFIAGFWILATGKSYVQISLKGLFRIDPVLAKKLWLIGLPSGVESFSRSFSQLVALSIISVYGTVALAVMGISNRLLAIPVIPLYGLLRGGSTVVGQNLGAELIERAEKTALSASALGGLLMAAMAVPACLFAEEIMLLFVSEPDVVEFGKVMIWIMFPGYLTVGFGLGLASVFPGSGHNKPLLISGIVSKWAVQLPVLFIIVRFFNLDLNFIWWAYVAAELLEVLIIAWYFREGSWKNKRVV